MAFFKAAITAATAMLLSFAVANPMSASPSRYVFHMSSLPGVTIIQPNTPAFMPAVTSLVDRTVLSSIQPVLPFSYVLKNTSKKFIIVYSTRWTLTDTAGQVTTQDRTWWNLSTLRDGDAIAPGASRLVSPIFRLGVGNAGPTAAALTRQIQQTLSIFASKPHIEISLETVIFEDGSAFGTDATNATAQAQAYLDAERQVASALPSGAVTTVGSANEVLNTMAAVSGRRRYQLSNPPQYDESLALYKQSLASALVKLTESKSGDAVSRIDKFQKNVASKQSLSIYRQ